MSTTPAPATEESKASPTSQTPTPQTTYPQWSTQVQASQIDPALLQQSQAAASHPHYQYQYHYPYGGYHQYVPQSSTSQSTQPSTTTAAASAAKPTATAAVAATAPPSVANAPVTATLNTSSSVPASQNQLDTTDVSKLNDALGGVVDLKAEEESLQRTADQPQAYRNNYDDRSHKQPSKPHFDTHFLGAIMRPIGKKHKVETIPEESINYVALALRTRLQDLVTEMISASSHRTGSAFDRAPSKYDDGTPMWSITVQRDVAKQLAALERAEREDEMRIRRERKELAAQLAAANGLPGPTTSAAETPLAEEEGPKKKKKKTDGPGVTAKNMPEDLRKKMSNQVASHAAGFGSKYSWMNTGTTPAPPKPRLAASSAAAASLSPAPAGSSTSATSSWSKPYISATKLSANQAEDSKQTITLRDALFVIEREKGHGGGRGAARGWS